MKELCRRTDRSHDRAIQELKSEIQSYLPPRKRCKIRSAALRLQTEHVLEEPSLPFKFGAEETCNIGLPASQEPSAEDLASDQSDDDENSISDDDDGHMSASDEMSSLSALTMASSLRTPASCVH